MNRYPVWKYIIILITLVVGVLYTLPNFFGEAPAVQVSAAKATVRVDGSTLSRVESVLQGASITPQRLTQEGTSVWARFDTPDTQLKAKDAIERALNPDAADPSYIVALNLVPVLVGVVVLHCAALAAPQKTHGRRPSISKPSMG